jgi:hypothetical protein
MRSLVICVLVLAGCAVPQSAPGPPQDDQADLTREALAYRIGEYETIRRRGPGLPGIVLVGTVGPMGAEPISDLDAALLARLPSDVFKIGQASKGEIRGKGPGPNFLWDKERNERVLRIVAAPPERTGDDATVDTFSAMSSWDAMGGWFRTTLKREAGAWKVVKSERKGGMP